MKVILWTVLSLIALIIIDLAVENSTILKEFYENYLSYFIDEPLIPPIVILLGIVLTVIVVRTLWAEKKEEFKQQRAQLEETIDRKEAQLASEVDLLIRANRELNSYRFINVLETLMQQFVGRHSHVLAIQSYQFEEKNINEQTIFKLNFSTGSVSSFANVNAIHQEIYYCDAQLLKDFRVARDKIKETGSPLEMLTFFINLLSQLNGKEVYDDKDLAAVSLMELSLELLESYTSTTIELENFLESESVELITNHLNVKRTGLFRAAIMEKGYYSFTHKKENKKLNRQYLAVLVNVRGEMVLFSIILDSSILDERLMDQLNEITEDFETLLRNLEIGYNNN